MDPTDDSELRKAVAEAASRDADAWEWLYRRSHPRLFAYARRRLSDDAAAEEAVSETMARALEKIDGFSWRGAGFDGWLYGILRNVVLETYRRRERDGREGHAGDPSPAPDAAPLADPYLAAERGDRRDAMREAFEQLDPDDREVLELRVVGELSSEQAGEVLGKKPGAVRMAQARALERLRHHLSRGGVKRG